MSFYVIAFALMIAAILLANCLGKALANYKRAKARKRFKILEFILKSV